MSATKYTPDPGANDDLEREDEALRRWYTAYTLDHANQGDAGAQAWLGRKHDELLPVLQDMRETLHSQASLSEDERLAYKGASKDRDAALLDIEAREDQQGKTFTARLEALGVDYDYAAFLADRLSDHTARAGNTEAREFYASRAELYREESGIIDAALAPPQQQQGDGITPPEVADQTPVEARTEKRDRVAEFLQDEDEQRRAGRGGGDMGSPALATLAANIRPDVVSTPGGLETITTQKSVDYPTDPEAANASDDIRDRLADAPHERSANTPTLTLEAIAADPQNAVELSLPADASKELLTAARDAVYPMADYLENWTGNYQDEDPAIRDETPKVYGRLSLINERLDQIAELDPATREANEADARRQQQEQQQGDGITPPEVADQSPAEVKTEKRDRVADFLQAENQARKDAKQEWATATGEELTEEKGEQIARNMGGGISI